MIHPSSPPQRPRSSRQSGAFSPLGSFTIQNVTNNPTSSNSSIASTTNSFHMNPITDTSNRLNVSNDKQQSSSDTFMTHVNIQEIDIYNQESLNHGQARQHGDAMFELPPVMKQQSNGLSSSVEHISNRLRSSDSIASRNNEVTSNISYGSFSDISSQGIQSEISQTEHDFQTTSNGTKFMHDFPGNRITPPHQKYQKHQNDVQIVSFTTNAIQFSPSTTYQSSYPSPQSNTRINSPKMSPSKLSQSSYTTSEYLSHSTNLNPSTPLHNGHDEENNTSFMNSGPRNLKNDDIQSDRLFQQGSLTEYTNPLLEEQRLHAQLNLTNTHIQKIKDQLQLSNVERKDVSLIREHTDEDEVGRKTTPPNSFRINTTSLGNSNPSLDIEIENSFENQQSNDGKLLSQESTDRYGYQDLMREQHSLLSLMSYKYSGLTDSLSNGEACLNYKKRKTVSSPQEGASELSPQVQMSSPKQTFPNQSSPQLRRTSATRVDRSNTNSDNDINQYETPNGARDNSISQSVYHNGQSDFPSQFSNENQKRVRTNESLYLSKNNSVKSKETASATKSPRSHSSSPRRTNFMSPTKSSQRMSRSPQPQHNLSPSRTTSDLVDASNYRKIIHYSPKDTPEDRLLKAHYSAKLRSTEAQLHKQKELRKEPLLHKSPMRRSTSPAHVTQLMKKQQEYDANREKKMREAQELEMQSFTGKPKINEFSKKLAVKRNGAIYNRLFEQQQEIQARKEKLIMESKKSEEKFSFQPSINQKSESIDKRLSLGVDNESRIDNMLQWGEEKKKKIELLRQLKEEKAKGKHTPRINSRSERIATNSDRAKLRVEDRLIQYAEDKKLDLEIKKLEDERSLLERAHPRINTPSPIRLRNSLDKSKNHDYVPAYDRLYSNSSEIEEKKRQIREQYERELLIDKETGQPGYTPRINARSSALIRHLPVEDILHMKGENTKHKISRLISEEKQRQKSQVAEKKVSAYSELLTILKEKRDGEHFEQRIQKPIHNISKHTKQQLDAFHKEHTFTPQINNKSRIIEKDKGESSTSPRYEVLIKKKEEYEAKKQRLQEHLVSEELAECTFRPSSQSNVSSRFVYNSPYTARASHQLDKSATKQMSEEIFIYYQ